MKKLKLTIIQIKRKSRFFLLLFTLVALGVAYYIIGRNMDFTPKLSYSYLDNSYSYSNELYKAKVRTEKEKVYSEFFAKDASIKTTLLGNQAEHFNDTASLFASSKKADVSAFYSLNEGEGLIEYIAEKKGLKEYIYLRDSTAQKEYIFELSLKNVSSYKKVKDEWIFFNKDKEEAFKIPKGYMIDSAGARSEDVSISVYKKDGKVYAKVKPSEKWLNDAQRLYPVAIDPTVSVVVSGGINDSDASFGTLQRKVVYSSSSNAWYVFYSDAGDVYYKKSTNSSTWGSAVDVDTSDADNYNPTIMLSGSNIYVTWIDDGSDAIEVNTINTASSDALGTKCTSSDLGTLGSSFMVSSALTSTSVWFAYSDTAAGFDFGIYELTFSGCTFTSRVTESGLTSLDRPVVMAVGDMVYVIFQDGDLSRSIWDGASWVVENETIASVTDNAYSVASAGSDLWILQTSGTTATRLDTYSGAFYKQIDSSLGSNQREEKITCPTADNCKLVYYDAGGSLALVFVDCNDSKCSSPTITQIASLSGAANGVSISCPTSSDCKVTYNKSASAAITFIDCENETCSSANTNDIITGLPSTAYTSVYCRSGTDCKIGVQTPSNLVFVDCDNATCTTNTQTNIASVSISPQSVVLQCPTNEICQVAFRDHAAGDVSFIACYNSTCSSNSGTIDIDTDAGSTYPLGMSCPTSTTCRVVYWDSPTSDIVYAYCSNVTCSSASTTSIDPDAGSSANIRVDVSCPAEDNCKIIYSEYVGNHAVRFVDCSNSACSSTTETYIIDTLSQGSVGVSISCVTGATCRLLYEDFDLSDLQFVDCEDEKCSGVTNKTAPWTSETNVLGVSLTQTNEGMLYAHIIKDASEQVYYKYSPVDSTLFSWSSETSIGFTAGDISQLSANINESATDRIAMAVRQGTNLEFAWYDPATADNQTTMLTRIGESTDAAGTTTLFARMKQISETKSGTSSDTGANATLFGRLGTATDEQQCTGTSCSNETIFGILKNIPGRSRNMLSQFGGYGTESTTGVCSTTGAIYISSGIHSYNGDCTVGNSSTATSIHPSVATAGEGGALFLYFKGDITVTNNAKIDVTGYGAQGGNGSVTTGTIKATGGYGGAFTGGNGGNGGVNVGAGGNKTASLSGGGGGGGGGGDPIGSGDGGGGGGGGGNGGNGGTSPGGTGSTGNTTQEIYQSVLLGKMDLLFSSYGGGGGGGGTGGAGGGGGGGGGGVIWIRTRSFTNNGTLSVNGGTGGLKGLTSDSAGRNGSNGFGGNGGVATNGGVGGATGSGFGGGGGGGLGGGILFIEANAVVLDSGGGLYARGANGGNGGNTNGSGSGGNGGEGANGFYFVEIVP